MSYRKATRRLFEEATEIKSRGCARNLLDELRAGVLEGYKYANAGSIVVAEYSPSEKMSFPDKLCYGMYSSMYRPYYMVRLPQGERSWRNAAAVVSWVSVLFIIALYGLIVYMLILFGTSKLVAQFVSIYFPE